MKKSIFKFGMTWAALLCVLFLFEMAPAQAQDVDLSIVNCSVANIPGTDSVIVRAGLQYLDAGGVPDSINFLISVEFDGTPVGSDDCYINTIDYSTCTESYPDCDGNCAPYTFGYSHGGVYTQITFTGDCEDFMGCFCNYNWRYVETFYVGPLAQLAHPVTIVVDDTHMVPEFDEDNNVCSMIYTPTGAVPSLTVWGMIVLAVLVLATGLRYIYRRKRLATATH